MVPSIHSHIRIFTVAAGFLAAAVISHAEEERSLQERLLEPNLEKRSSIEGMEFDGGDVLELKTFETEAYAGARAFSTETYETPRFLGIPIPWFTDRKAPVEASPLEQKTFAESLRAYGVDDADTDAGAADGNRSAEAPHDRAAGRTHETPTAHVEGASQQSLTDYSEKLREGMTVEEVREFLNRTP